MNLARTKLSREDDFQPLTGLRTLLRPELQNMVFVGCEDEKIVFVAINAQYPLVAHVLLVWDAVLQEIFIEERDDDDPIAIGDPNQILMRRLPDPFREADEFAVVEAVEFDGDVRGGFHDFEVIVVDEEMAPGEVKGIFGSISIVGFEFR